LGIEGGIGGWGLRLAVLSMLLPRFGRSVVSDRTVGYGSWRLDVV